MTTTTVAHCMALVAHDAHTWDAPVYGGEVTCPGSVRIPFPANRNVPGATRLVRRDRVAQYGADGLRDDERL